MDKKDLEALYKIHGGKEKYERWAKRRLEYYSKEDAELEDQFLQKSVLAYSQT